MALGAGYLTKQKIDFMPKKRFCAICLATLSFKPETSKLCNYIDGIHKWNFITIRVF